MIKSARWRYDAYCHIAKTPPLGTLAHYTPSLLRCEWRRKQAILKKSLLIYFNSVIEAYWSKLLYQEEGANAKLAQRRIEQPLN